MSFSNFDNDFSKITQLSNNLFLSGAYPLEKVNDYNIKYILCCVKHEYVADVYNKIFSMYPYLVVIFLPYEDDVNQNLWMINNNNDYNKIISLLQLYNKKPMIEIGYHFIDLAIKNNHHILVHCMAGISRSVSVITYYIMKKYNVDYNCAANFIKSKRFIANPNDSFKKQLQFYDKQRDNFGKNIANEIIKNFKV